MMLPRSSEEEMTSVTEDHEAILHERDRETERERPQGEKRTAGGGTRAVGRGASGFFAREGSQGTVRTPREAG